MLGIRNYFKFVLTSEDIFVYKLKDVKNLLKEDRHDRV